MTACICIRSHFYAIWSGPVKGHVQIWRSSRKWGEIRRLLAVMGLADGIPEIINTCD